MIWVIAFTIVGLLVGARFSRGALRAGTRLPPLPPLPPAAGMVASTALILLALVTLLFAFSGGMALIGLLGAVAGGAAWSLLRRGRATPWLPAAQGTAAGLLGACALVGLVLAVSSLGGPLANYPSEWRGLVGDRALPVIAAAVRGGSLPAKRAALAIAGERPRGGLDIALPAVRDPDPSVRAAVAPVLPQFPGERSLQALLKLAADPDKSVREATWKALQGQKDPRALQAIFHAAGGESVGSALSGLASTMWNDQAFAAPAVGCATGGGGCAADDLARAGALVCLGRAETPGGGAAVVKALRDPVPVVRAAAVTAAGARLRAWRDELARTYLNTVDLGNVGAASNGEPEDLDQDAFLLGLASALRDPDPKVRQAAAGGLQEALFPDLNWAGKIVHANDPDVRIPRPDRALPDRLQPGLKDPDPKVRVETAEALAWLGDRRAVPTLRELDGTRLANPYACSICGALLHLGDGPILHQPYPSRGAE